MPEPDKVLSKEEAEKVQHNLSLLPKPHVEEAYLRAFADAALVRGTPPSPSTIQRLLCIWKILWRWKERETRR